MTDAERTADAKERGIFWESNESEWYGPDPAHWDDDPNPYLGTYSEE